MYVKTFQATDLLALMETVRAEMGPMAVLLSVRRIEMPEGTVLEGAAAVDREALPTANPEASLQAPPAPATPAVPPVNPTPPKLPPVRPEPAPPTFERTLPREMVDVPPVRKRQKPEKRYPDSIASSLSLKAGAWLKRSASGLFGGSTNRLPRKPSPAKRTSPPLIMLVGPTGSGKTTMAAKVAAYLRNREELPTGLVTTDVGNSSGVLRLRESAQRLRMPMAAAQSASELRDILQRWGGRGPLVMDTPGLAAEATETVRTLVDWLRSWIPNVETHLVLDVDRPCDQGICELNSFREAGCQKVMLTRMDRRSEVDGEGMISQVMAARLPISFLGTGTRVPQDIAIPTPERLMMAWA